MRDTYQLQSEDNLVGNLFVMSPGAMDLSLGNAVLLLAETMDEGRMQIGIIVNRPHEKLSLADWLNAQGQKLDDLVPPDIATSLIPQEIASRPIGYGGPDFQEDSRGFVLMANKAVLGNPPGTEPPPMEDETRCVFSVADPEWIYKLACLGESESVPLWRVFKGGYSFAPEGVKKLLSDGLMAQIPFDPEFIFGIDDQSKYVRALELVGDLEFSCLSWAITLTNELKKTQSVNDDNPSEDPNIQILEGIIRDFMPRLWFQVLHEIQKRLHGKASVPDQHRIAHGYLLFLEQSVARMEKTQKLRGGELPKNANQFHGIAQAFQRNIMSDEPGTFSDREVDEFVQQLVNKVSNQ